MFQSMNMRDEFSRAAASYASYDKAAVLAREVGRRMAERLDWVRLSPRRLADIGCATGDGVSELQRRYPQALPLAIDFARPMLTAVAARSGWIERLRGRAPRCINADVRALPLTVGSLDLVWSNLMLHWLPAPDDLSLAFTELHRVLAVGGLLQFTMLGPDTLKELRAVCTRCGTVLPAPTFIDMHDIGDMLVAAGFADPVMEMEMLTLTYRTPRAFLADQRHLGVRDGLLGQLGWQQWRQIFAAWQQANRQNDNLLPAHFEIIYGHAWKLAPTLLPDGRAIVHFDRIK